MSRATVTLADFVTDWRPAPVSAQDVITARVADELAATLDLDQRFADGDALPLLWQWAYFLDWPGTAELGPDGHPLHGHFLPPIPNRRRMFAGGRVRVTRPLRIGAPVTRTSEIVDIAAKHGRTGELLFVTVRHTYTDADGEYLAEEQDLVYRSDDGSSTPFARVSAALPEPTTPWHAEPKTVPALLFRFSALTGNAHRIHYDESYTTGVEGFPGLVVHGPLLAVYLAELLRAQVPERTVASFEFRLQKPVFLGDPIRVQATPGDPVQAAVISAGDASAGDTVHATAKVIWS